MRFGLIAVGNEMSHLQDHVWTCLQTLVLPAGQEFRDVKGKSFLSARISQQEFKFLDFFGSQHHAPGKSVSLFCPGYISGIEKMPERDENLEQYVHVQEDKHCSGCPSKSSACLHDVG